MPTIKVNTSRLGNYESDMQEVLSRVNSIMNQFNSVSRNLDWDIKAESNINSRLSGISRELSAEARGISGMKKYLGIARRQYNSVENINSRRKLKNEVTGHGYSVRTYNKRYNTKRTGRYSIYGGGRYSWRDIDPKRFPPGTVPWMKNASYSNSKNPSTGDAETALTFEFWSLWSDFKDGKWSVNLNNYADTEKDSSYFRRLAGSISASFKPGKYLKYSDKKALSDGINDTYKFLNDSDKNVIPKQKKIPIKQINPDVSWYSQKGTIAEVKGETKIKGSVIDAKASGESKYAKGSAEAKLFTGEVHASTNAGLYVYDKGPDGEVKRLFSPEVAAEVGASVAVVDLIAEGRVGLGKDNNMLGAYGKAEVKADSAEAKAKVAINRKEVYAGASAEADLVKAEATGGVSVLGTDIGVSGAVKVGVGAHAEVGYTDGKIKVDVGAAIGVGVDIGFEVDISGTVDAVCDKASAAWESFKSWW